MPSLRHRESPATREMDSTAKVPSVPWKSLLAPACPSLESVSYTHLTNKVKYLVGKVSCIQSVGSVKLAKEISRLCLREGATMKVLVEVNIGREESKGGVLPEALFEVVDEIRTLPGLHVEGLMAIPPICEKKAELCGYFSAVRQSYVDIAAKKLDNVSMNCLSMGMSSDFQEAIACGATMVRVGSSLFGKRDYPQHYYAI